MPCTKHSLICTRRQQDASFATIGSTDGTNPHDALKITSWLIVDLQQKCEKSAIPCACLIVRGPRVWQLHWFPIFCLTCKYLQVSCFLSCTCAAGPFVCVRNQLEILRPEESAYNLIETENSLENSNYCK